MKKAILIHNPRCSKSREAKSFLEESEIDFVTVDYLKDGLKEKLLAHLPTLTGLSYRELIRLNDDAYVALKLDEAKMTDDDWVKTLMSHPAILERPIFIMNNRATIGRPLEKIKALLATAKPKV